MTNSKDSCAFSPELEAVIKAVGLSENTVVETVHSMAFFKMPGRLNTYSGVQMITPSASLISLRSFCTSKETSASVIS